jgi:low temperature requirement protein LtrA
MRNTGSDSPVHFAVVSGIILLNVGLDFLLYMLRRDLIQAAKISGKIRLPVALFKTAR